MFARICSVSLEHGQLRGAIVRLDVDNSGVLSTAAFSESMRVFAQQVVVSNDPALPDYCRPSAIAYREGRLCIDNDVLAESSGFAFKDTARALGIGSAAALPLKRASVPIGVVLLLAEKPQFFDEEMRRLLEQLGTDISFALDNFEGERQRRDTERALAESEEKFRALVEQSIAGIYVVEEGRFTYVNPRLAEIAGYTPGELIGQPVTMLVAEEDQERVAENIRKRLSGEVRSIQYTVTGKRKDSSRITIGIHGARATVEGRPVIIGLAQDISERDRAQRQIRAYLEQLEAAMLGTVQAVSTIVEMRDPYTAGHEKRVGALARAIGQELGLPEETCRGLEIIGTVHDIGKVSVPAEILSKPGRLTEMEFAIIKNHSQLGHDVMKGVAFPWPLAQTILQHHERLDGSGYPAGLKGDAIILEARILAVADVVESMCSHRPYRPTRGIEAALEEISAHRGTHYDERVVDACLRLFREKGYRLPD